MLGGVCRLSFVVRCVLFVGWWLLCVVCCVVLVVFVVCVLFVVIVWFVWLLCVA